MTLPDVELETSPHEQYALGFVRQYPSRAREIMRAARRLAAAAHNLASLADDEHKHRLAAALRKRADEPADDDWHVVHLADQVIIRMRVYGNTICGVARVTNRSKQQRL